MTHPPIKRATPQGEKEKLYILTLSNQPENPCVYQTARELAESLEDMMTDYDDEPNATIKIVWKPKGWFDKLTEWEPCL